VNEGTEAFVVRARSAYIAGRSLDVQTYIWHADTTGGYLAYRLLQAADRGVKVRLLVDDMDARGKHYSFAALDAHPNIQVRMFNPFQSRRGKLRFAAEALGDFDRINRRMHNKSWIADNRIALVGGRNLGDEYFGAGDEVNFVDLDFVMIGPIVRDVSASFDRYWNSEVAYPIDLLAPKDVAPEALAALRARIAPLAEEAGSQRYAQELQNDQAVQKLVAGDWPMQWTSAYRFIADDPLKAMGKEAGLLGSDVLALLRPMVMAAASEINIISPYFVPGKAGTDRLTGIAQSGRAVNILTNSLAANDVAAVYGGYSRWRKPLLQGGVKLWELKPVTGSKVKSGLFGSSGASLHTKALAVDNSRVFVGSYNLDPRSTSLNTEQGVFVEDPLIGAQLDRLFAAQTAATRAWAVTLEDDALRWNDGDSTLDRAPGASLGKKFQAWLARVLRIDAQL
jgi:putative cardiolipin synthase